MDEKPLKGDSFVVRESQHYRSDAINGRFVARGVIATVIALIIILTILVIVLGSLLGKARSSGGEVDDKCKGKWLLSYKLAHPAADKLRCTLYLTVVTKDVAQSVEFNCMKFS